MVVSTFGLLLGQTIPLTGYSSGGFRWQKSGRTSDYRIRPDRRIGTIHSQFPKLTGLDVRAGTNSNALQIRYGPTLMHSLNLGTNS